MVLLIAAIGIASAQALLASCSPAAAAVVGQEQPRR
jgi:hypothetical protein